MLCGALFGLPFLLLHDGATRASRVSATPVALAALRTHDDVMNVTYLDGVNLPSHLVAYQAPQSTTTTAPPAPTTTTTTAPPAPPTTTTDPAPVVAAAPPPPPPTTTTTTAPPAPPAPTNSEVGQATWYPEAPDGMCASPTLPFGTVLTVTNNITGASTQCTVDDREGAGYPRVVDMSYSGFSQIADPSQGVADVTISW
jgi:rare lipoprotein A (peptidoglycan hydrolase)